MPQGGPYPAGAPTESPWGAPLHLLFRVMTMPGRWKNITPTMISKTLSTAVGFCGPNLGLEAKNMFARFSSTTGTMPPLLSVVDSVIFKLIGR